MDLRKRWVQDFGSEEFFTDTIAAYTENHRYYHDISHIIYCFRQLDQYFYEVPIVCRYAIWFHDFVYEPLSRDNEYRSAKIASNHVPKEYAEEVYNIIQSTKYHKAEDRNAQIVNDIDMSIFMGTYDEVAVYDRNIMQEFSASIKENYNETILNISRKRKEFLKELFKTDIFSTPEMARHNNAARWNIERLLNNKIPDNCEECDSKIGNFETYWNSDESKYVCGPCHKRWYSLRKK